VMLPLDMVRDVSPPKKGRLRPAEAVPGPENNRHGGQSAS
jgi:hypothetical protein